MPAGLRGRVIFGKGNGMEELIKRLERVIQTGAPDKDGMHPISAEAVLEVVKELSEHGTNLAEVGTDCISRQAAIDALDQIFDRCEEIEAHLPEGDPDRTGYKMYPDYMTVWKYLHQLPSAQPKRGRWHYSDGKPARIGLSFGVVCDQCGTESEYCTNFCGECGADMRGEQDG